MKDAKRATLRLVIATCRVPCMGEDYPYPCPEIHQVLKWLREEHVFHVEILREKYNGWMYFIQLSDASYVTNHNGFDSYESAALAGVLYCLDNLI